jgi:hypothetical protein
MIKDRKGDYVCKARHIALALCDSLCQLNLRIDEQGRNAPYANNFGFRIDPHITRQSQTRVQISHEKSKAQ